MNRGKIVALIPVRQGGKKLITLWADKFIPIYENGENNYGPIRNKQELLNNLAETEIFLLEELRQLSEAKFLLENT